jgi:hypothetical protein
MRLHRAAPTRSDGIVRSDGGDPNGFRGVVSIGWWREDRLNTPGRSEGAVKTVRIAFDTT